MARLISGGGSTAPSSRSQSTTSKKDDLEEIYRRIISSSPGQSTFPFPGSSRPEPVLPAKSKNVQTNISHPLTYPLPNPSSSKLHSEPKKPNAEAEISRRLNFSYYGFLLYHTGNRRLQFFVNSYSNILDEISGEDICIFTLSKKPKHKLVIDELLADKALDMELRKMIQKWREYTIAFTIDKSFDIASSIGLSRKDIPCLIIFPSHAKDYKTFALLKLKDSWFPEDTNDKEGLDKTINWLTELFDAFTQTLKANRPQEDLIGFQKHMNASARKQKLYLPIGRGLRSKLLPLISLPFRLIATLPAIFEKIGVEKLKSLLGEKRSDDT